MPPVVSPYQQQNYLKTQANWGEPVWFEHAQGWVCQRKIPQSQAIDLITPYPFGYFEQTEHIQADAQKSNAVSLVWVSDPLVPQQELSWDVCVPFKTHYWVDFSKPHAPSTHHRYEVKNAHSDLQYLHLKDPPSWHAQWDQLYQNLVQRHHLKGGFYDYSFEQSQALLNLPQTVLFAAFYKGEAVLMHVWLMSSQARVYSHLVAPGPEAYEMRAAYGLYNYALGYFHKQGVQQCFLGSGRQNQDGLARFKAGWANVSGENTLYGMILKPDIYHQLCSNAHHDFFPAYRRPHV